jgi:hypothetical protein
MKRLPQFSWEKTKLLITIKCSAAVVRFKPTQQTAHRRQSQFEIPLRTGDELSPTNGRNPSRECQIIETKLPIAAERGELSHRLEITLQMNSELKSQNGQPQSEFIVQEALNRERASKRKQIEVLNAAIKEATDLIQQEKDENKELKSSILGFLRLHSLNLESFSLTRKN